MRHKHKRTKWIVPTGTKCSKRGAVNRRVLARHVEGGREYTLHATKGWRSHKV